MGFKLSRAADGDLVRIYAEGAELFGYAQADRYLDGLWDKFTDIAANPLHSAERAELTPPMRVRPYHSHVILYLMQEDDVLIVRIRHGREDWL